MRVLITSGGTKVPIDPIRNITNSSSGRFGSEIARAALMSGMEVIYLTAETSQSPFAKYFDFYNIKNSDRVLNEFKQHYEFCNRHREQYCEYRYRDFFEYAELLHELISRKNPHIVILSAAVSDYLVDNYSDVKIRSNENLQIRLKVAPKVIHTIKAHADTIFLVGFKLLVDAPEIELIDAAKKLLNQHQADLVIANNLSSIKAGAHEIILVDKNGTSQKITEYLPETIIANVLKRVA